jgi:hypothetical protein
MKIVKMRMNPCMMKMMKNTWRTITKRMMMKKFKIKIILSMHLNMHKQITISFGNNKDSI